MADDKKLFENGKRYKIGVIVEKKYSTKHPEFNEQYPAFVYTGEQLKKKFKCKDFVEYLEKNYDSLPSRQIFSCYEVVENLSNKTKPSYEFFDMGQPTERIQNQMELQPSQISTGLNGIVKDDNEILDLFKNQTARYQDFTQAQLNDVKATYQAQLELERQDKERQIQLMKEQLDKVVEIKDHAITQQKQVADDAISQLKMQIEEYKSQITAINNAKTINNEQYDGLVVQLQKEKQELWGVVNERETSVRDFYSQIIASKEAEIAKLANSLEAERQEHIKEIGRLQEELHRTKAELDADRKINSEREEMDENYHSKLSGLEEEKQDAKIEILGSLVELGKMLLPSLVQMGTTYFQNKQQQIQGHGYTQPTQPMQAMSQIPPAQRQPLEYSPNPHLSDNSLSNVSQLEASDNYKGLIKHLMLNFKLDFKDSISYLNQAIGAMKAANNLLDNEVIEQHLIESWINKDNEQIKEITNE